ncbi:MAG: 2-C-methyl-D-erythritol 4-phosphate cytidylyltransferase [Blastocatellia bacterium]|nr:2-C-methyl-D-erythritol 4-phosphate cytidylyltransferase [Blastocatellia bacterium]
MNIAIIPAAGSGARFGGERPKQFLEIRGIPIIIHTLRKFDICSEIDAIIVAVQPAEFDSFHRLLQSSGLRKPLQVVNGGKERSDSIANALAAAAETLPELPDLVAIHDAVRPFVTPAQISAVLARARETGAAILALAATDTIKEVERGFIRRTIDRDRIYRAQTPQAFRYDLLLRANAEARARGALSAATDDSLLIEGLGLPVAIVEGSAQNIKITTPDDLIQAEGILQQMEPAGSRAQIGIRIGLGYDIHRLVAGRKLILGGSEIPYDRGLLGHSDGDSLTHAIIDALLGAAGLGDIGAHFPDTDPRFKNGDSIVFLRHARSLLHDLGYQIAHIDSTILAERPKMMPHIPVMKSRLAEAMAIDTSQINIKAKTNEGMDAVGSGDAIAAQAVALIHQR